MTVTSIDMASRLIERPHERAAADAKRPRRAGALDMRQLPHGEALTSDMQIAGIACDVLLGMGCLIETVTVRPGRIRIALSRAPYPGVLEYHATHEYWAAGGGPGEAIKGLVWRGVHIEWPVHTADIPDLEGLDS